MKLARILTAAVITVLAGAAPHATPPQPPAAPTTTHHFAAQLRAAYGATLVEAPDGTLFGAMSSGGVGDFGAIVKLAPDGAGGFTFSILRAFTGVDGADPRGLTYHAPSDTLYGVTASGGVNGPLYDGMGTVFSLTRTGVLTTLHDFDAFSVPQPLNPQAALLLASDGNFYGTGSAASTAPGSGAIFSMTPAGHLELLHTFSGSDGASPSSKLVEGTDGFLYGTTTFGGQDGAGTVFRIRKDGTDFGTLHHFTAIDASSNQPRGLVLDTSSGSDVFYGLTAGGGPDSRGTVFTITPSGTFSLRASFTVTGGMALEGAYPNGALVKAADGLFYGTTEAQGPTPFGSLGTVFSFDPATGTIGVVHDYTSDFLTGAGTNAGLMLAADGSLLGTTMNGGAHRVGTVYRVDPSTFPQAVTKVVDVPSLGPAVPQDRLLRASDGFLYGTTVIGGDFNSGAIFRVNIDGTATQLHSFNFIDGHLPAGELVEGSDGNLWGTTTYGGNVQFSGDFAGGTIFRIAKDGTNFTVVHRFADYSVEGAHPLAGLVEGPDGNFYGTTHQNGPNLAGTVFKVTPSGTLTTLHGFSVWSSTRSTLVIGEDGYFYGVTREGGSNPNGGTAYKIDSNGNFVLLHEFVNPADGAHPNGVTLGTDGNLYGTTEHGGTFYGTLFQLTPAGGLTVLHRFDTTVDGANPTAIPIEAGDGKLYGQTWFGGRFPPFFSGLGTLYRYDSAGVQLLHTFGAPGSDSGSPYAGLTQGADNLLWGATTNTPGGTIYAFDQGITNKAPTARHQRVAIGPGASAAVNLVAADPDGDPLTFSIVGQPAHGSVSGSGPAFLYEPNPGFSGTDVFYVRVNDGTVSSPVAGVMIVVGAPNAAPSANDQSITLDEDTSTSIALTGSDPEGSALSFTVLMQPAHGILSGTAPNLTFTATGHYHGPDSFTFKVNDGALDSAEATVSITVNAVNDTPAADSQSVTTDENVARPITLTGSDADGDGLTFVIVAQPSHGTLSGTAPNVVYTPDSAYTGADAFTFKVNDGTVDSGVASVSIAVTAVNHPPEPFFQLETVIANTPTPILLGASDPDGDPLTFFIVTQPAHGVLSGTAPNVTYTPDTNYVGQDTFTFNANDGTVDGGGGTVRISVTAPANRAPVAHAGGPYTGDVGGSVTLDGSGSTDPDIPFGDTLTYLWTIVTSSGTDLYVGGPTLAIPAANVASLGGGTFPVSLRLSDGRGLEHTAQTTLTLRVPIASFTATPNPAACHQVITFDASASENARPGRTIIYYAYAFGDGTSALGKVGPHSDTSFGSYLVDLTVTDDLGISATSRQTVTIDQGNQPPAANPGGPYATLIGNGISFSGAGSDPNAGCGDSIVSYSWLINGTIVASGDAPALAAAQIASLGVGTFPVQLTVTDEFGATGSASTTLTVQPLTAGTTTDLQTSATALGALQPFTFTAIVSPVPPAGGVPAGDVEFVFNGTTVLGAGSLVGGRASITANGLPIGTHSITARYLGAGGFTGSVSPALSITVRPLAESSFTFLVPWTTRQALGSPVIVSAIVIPMAAGPAANGTVELYDGPILVATATLSSGVGTMSWIPTAAGARTISARYLGSSTLAPSSSQLAVVTVYTGALPASTTTTLAIAPSPAIVGGPVALTATVGGGTPGDAVIFFVDGVQLGAAPLLNVGGTLRATLNTSALPAGAHVISASYGGGSGFAASNSSPLVLVVNP